MKKTILTSALCLTLMATGCVNNGAAPASAPAETTSATETTTETTAATTEATTESSAPETSETKKTAHQVTVEVLKKMTYSDGNNEFSCVYPKITVDGKEASSINRSLTDHIQKKYPMEKDGVNIDGWATKISWGANENTLSVVILASDVSTDYFTTEVFNYDLDTLEKIDDSEVTKRLGLTDADLFAKTKEILTKYCKERGYNLDKSLADVNYDKITPYITRDGKAGVAATVYYVRDSQFSGMDSVRTFSLHTMDYDV
ncbi:MAG: hypothetical protein K6E60_09100 [Saccharofermentans sp.]|nr:hypothetical protein [Saccharofermentans sp.]